MAISKWLKYSLNILKSYWYDMRIAMSDGLKERALARTFSIYRATKLYPAYLKQGAAIDGVRYLARKFCYGKGIDVGAGIWPFDGARPIENLENENAYLLNEKNASLDFVFSSHLLEHLEQPKVAILEWARVLKTGGVLFLYLPHPACSMWLPEHLNVHLWMPDPLVVKELLEKKDMFEVTEISYTPDGMMSYYVVARRR